MPLEDGGIRCPGVGVVGSCELLGVGAGGQTGVHCRSSVHSDPLSCLSGPRSVLFSCLVTRGSEAASALSGLRLVSLACPIMPLPISSFISCCFV